ncbi:myeloid zinc finger 1 [Apis mellifera]|uniref:Myeloid zinc finger 1 n=1 Tax=Apis mellifera TaxID=7460 RepID=A0A7M7MNP9_APIME|nr:myeloid zinc finger 1 [Apis mellifera]|eukprot:XP_026298752.1 myeloid zinc finger 1 [Apis mellifera]
MEEYNALLMLNRRVRTIGEEEDSSPYFNPFESSVGGSTGLEKIVDRSKCNVATVGGPFVCFDCGKRYKWHDSLRRHKRVDCGTTEKKYSYAYVSLQLPYGLPSGFQPYSANVNLSQKDEMKYLRGDGSSLMNVCFGCGKRYKWRDSLLRHQRVECGNKEKKFCCKLCPKKFYHQYKLNEHYQGRHKIPKPR